MIDPRYRNKLDVNDGILNETDRVNGLRVLKKWADDSDGWGGAAEDEEEEKVDDHMDVDSHRTFKKIFNDYKNRRGIFGDPHFAPLFDELNEHNTIKEVEDAYKFLGQVQEYANYAEWCLKYLSINGQSVDVERSFSAVRIIHSARRRNMKSENLANIVYCYWNVRALDKAGID
eukprot:37718_1